MNASVTPGNGAIRAVVFDWAGTTVDYGCMAPAAVFVEVFRREGVEVTMEEARGPMGMYKRDHIRTMAQMPEVAARWQQAHGTAPEEDDIDRMYQQFVPLQLACLAEHADVIPGAVETIEALRSRAIRIGSSTGYTREMMDIVCRTAEPQGYVPDAVVCGDEVPAGRPAPWLLWENAKRLDVYPAAAIVKVDDTVPGIAAGHNAGTWTIGVAKTGNAIGLTETELAALSAEEQASRLAHARKQLGDAGAHFVVDSVVEVPRCIEEIEARLLRGGKP